MVKSYLSRRQVGVRDIFQDSDIPSSSSILHLIGKQATKGQVLESNHKISTGKNGYTGCGRMGLPETYRNLISIIEQENKSLASISSVRFLGPYDT